MEDPASAEQAGTVHRGDGASAESNGGSTDREQLEQEVLNARRRLVEAQRLAGLGLWEWHVAENRIVWSDELFRIFGLEPGEIEIDYDEYMSRIHPDDREAIDRRTRRALVDLQPFEDVKRCLRPDGSIFLLQNRGEVVVGEDGDPIRMQGISQDVTDKKQAEEATAQLASIVLSSEDAIVSRTLDGEITSWNPAAERIYGYTAEEALGQQVQMLVPPELISGDDLMMDRLVKGERVEHFEAQRVRKDGSVIDMSLTMSAIYGADAELIGISTIGRDITDRKRIEERLKQLANHDPLTGLYNRHRFEEELILNVAKMRRYGTEGAVLVLDLDNFKYVNDGYGHGAGDDVLRGIAQLLRGRLRQSDVLARIGGDEFAVLIPEANRERAHLVAAELLEHVRDQTLQLSGQPIRVTTSIGVTMIDGATTGAEELLAEADRAMYEAKDSGRDRAITLEPADRGGDAAPGHRNWDHRIREALELDSFVLHSQPILDLATDRVSQHELLIRMQGDNGHIPPGAFLGDAERLGLIHEIDRWVVTEAITLLGERPDLQLEVNLSGSSADDERLLKLIRTELESSGADPHRLIFEITETAAIASMDQARQFAEALRELGCRFALDDFGAGFGSFYYLKHIPVDFLKIDGDFVRSPRSRTDEMVVESIVHMARGLGKRTIAEFVEDSSTLEALRAAGVDFAQGFHIGRPTPLSELPPA